MEIKDVRIGMKVVVHNKSAGVLGLKNSPSWNRAMKNKQPFLYVIGSNFICGSSVWILSDTFNNIPNGDYFCAKNFEEYKEKAEENKMETKQIALKLTLENGEVEISHTQKDWGFTEADPETIHAYIDAIVDLLKAASFSEEVILDGFREWVEDRESEIY